MLYVTGDTHGDYERFTSSALKKLKKGDTLFICGDFGFIWNGSKNEEKMLKKIGKLKYNVCFIDGTHENFERLRSYEVSEFKGGKVHHITGNLYHLMRGQVYTIEGKTFFTMGGAACHDIQNGVLDPADPMFDVMYRELSFQNKFFRIKHYSWWKQELPSWQELESGWCKLSEYDFQVDYILTHCAPTNLQNEIAAILRNDTYPTNDLTDFLPRVYDRCSYSHWFCGHYHRPMDITPAFHVLYEHILPLPEK